MIILGKLWELESKLKMAESTHRAENARLIGVVGDYKAMYSAIAEEFERQQMEMEESASTAMQRSEP